MYCLSMEPNHLSTIKELNYIPVGLGRKTFSKEWMKDNTGKNITHKNKYYGEYTFHYWLWKNYLGNTENEWIGFCQYRKFWSLQNINKDLLSLKKLKDLTLKEVPEEFNNYEVILGDSISINNLKVMKFLKRGFKLIIKKPSYLYNKNKRNIKFHFDMWHGENYLSEAIKLLNNEDRENFNNFVNTNTSFNPHNMFICKSSSLLKRYYETLFDWLQKCEDIFGFSKLKGYGMTRIYGFLAERYLSYWFQKNTKVKEYPIIFKDLSDYKNF